MAYLKHAHENGVRNIEMESLVFASMCHYAGIKGWNLILNYLSQLTIGIYLGPHGVYTIKHTIQIIYTPMQIYITIWRV